VEEVVEDHQPGIRSLHRIELVAHGLVIDRAGILSPWYLAHRG
jgi:hypothetical protein